MDTKTRQLVLAKLYFKNKDYEMAETSLNQYINENPTDVAALKLMAQIYEQDKRFQQAYEMYERCYLAEPDRTGVLLDICRTILMEEKLENAYGRKWLSQAMKAFPQSPIVVTLKMRTSQHSTPVSSPKQQTAPQSANLKQVSHANDEAHNEDMSKILEQLINLNTRLSSVDGRLLDIERRIDNMSIKERPAEKQAPATISNTDINTNSSSPATVLSSEKPSLFGSLTNNKGFPVSSDSIPSKHASSIFGNIPKVEPTSTQNPQSAPAKNKSIFGNMGSKLGSPTASKQPTAPKEPTAIFGNLSLGKEPLSFGGLSANLGSSPFGGGSAFGKTSPFGGLSTNEESAGFDGPSLSKDSIPFGLPPIAASDKDDPRGDDQENELAPNEELPIENTCDMQPIEIKTGEEDEEVLLEQRSKLFRFRDKEYKERGLGNIKVLRNKSTGKGRLIMRRDAIGLVCLNCWDCSKIERVKDTQVRFAGVDASDGDAVGTIFLAKFKTHEMASAFMDKLTLLFLEDDGSADTSHSTNTSTRKNLDQSDGELVNP